MKRITFMLIGGVGAVLLGLPYIYHAFGPTEAEVITWGRVSLYIGITLVILSIGTAHSSKGLAKIILGLGYTVLALLQVFPIFLWLSFHGSGISDGAPPSAFVAHWGYSLPHVALLIVCIVVLYRLFRSKAQPLTGEAG